MLLAIRQTATSPKGHETNNRTYCLRASFVDLLRKCLGIRQKLPDSSLVLHKNQPKKWEKKKQTNNKNTLYYLPAQAKLKMDNPGQLQTVLQEGHPWALDLKIYALTIRSLCFHWSRRYSKSSYTLPANVLARKPNTVRRPSTKSYPDNKIVSACVGVLNICRGASGFVMNKPLIFCHLAKQLSDQLEEGRRYHEWQGRVSKEHNKKQCCC